MKFNPPKYQCKSCGDVIYSKTPGHFAYCSCYKNEEGNAGIAVDYTEYYGRHIGNPNNFILIEDVK